MEKILVLCNDRWHPAEVIEKGLAALQSDRFEFDVFKAAKDILTPERIAGYRLILCCKSNNISSANEQPWFEAGTTEVGPKELAAYIRAGGGFLAVHSGLAYSQANCPDYVDFTGAQFLSHPPRCKVALHAASTAHPIAAGVGDFSIRDEHYCMEMLCEDADVFLTSTSELGGTQPAGYTRELGAGRLCALTPGHILAVWEHPQFQRLLVQAMEWCLKKR